MIIQRIQNQNNNFNNKKHYNQNVGRAVFVGSTLVGKAVNIDKFEKNEFEQKEVNNKNISMPFENLLPNKMINFMGIGGHWRRLSELKKDIIDDVRYESSPNEAFDSPLIKAVRDKNTEIIAELLQKQNIDPNVQDKNGNTPLYLAVRDKNIDAVKELLKHPDIDPNIQNKVNDSPLIRAVYDDNTEIINVLLKNKKIDINNVKDKWGDTPFQIAVHDDNVKIAKKLLTFPNLDPNVVSGGKNPPLIHAYCVDKLKLFTQILQHPNVDPNVQDDCGNTSLYLAARDNRIEYLNELLKHPDIDPNIQNKDKDSPLIRVVNRLKWVNPCLQQIKDDSMEVFSKLLALPNINPNVQDKFGETPLNIAAQYEIHDVVKELLKLPNLDPNIKGEFGVPAIYWAIHHNDRETFNGLLKLQNLDPNIISRYGDTPLYSAVYNKNLDMVKELLKHPNINPNIKNERTETSPLIFSIYNKDMEAFFDELIKHSDIDPNITNLCGESALEVALRKKQNDIVEKLLKHPKLNANEQLLRNAQSELYNIHKTPVQIKAFANIKNILTQSQVSASYGASLNSTDFIAKTVDYLLENATLEEKQGIIRLLKPLSNVSYNKADENGITPIEKILNAEDFDLLELLKGKNLEYNKDYDYAFRRIENDEFRKQVLNLKFQFTDLETAINIESSKALEKCKTQFESPLFNPTKNGAELWTSVRTHWDNQNFVSDFINNYYKYCIK